MNLKKSKVAQAIALATVMSSEYAQADVSSNNIPQEFEDSVVKDVNIQLDEFEDNSSVGYVTFQPTPIEGNKDQPLTKNWARSNFTIETKRAGLIPMQYLDNPKASRIAVDVRILDEDGNPVFTQISGHSPADPTWLPYEPIGSTNTDDLADKSQRVFAALTSVLPLYAEKLKSLGLDPEQQALSNLTTLKVNMV